jgi:prophage regulatory protein
MNESNQFPREGLVRVRQILEYLNIGKTAWWAGVKDGRYPKPIKLGGVTAWRAVSIRELAGE